MRLALLQFRESRGESQESRQCAVFAITLTRGMEQRDICGGLDVPVA